MEFPTPQPQNTAGLDSTPKSSGSDDASSCLTVDYVTLESSSANGKQFTLKTEDDAVGEKAVRNGDNSSQQAVRDGNESSQQALAVEKKQPKHQINWFLKDDIYLLLQWRPDWDYAERRKAVGLFAVYIVLFGICMLFFDGEDGSNAAIPPTSKITSSFAFIFSFITLLFGAYYISKAVDAYAIARGPAIGGIVLAFGGNVLEIVVGALALKKGLYNIVMTSLVGSILSNLLLVLGTCYLVAGHYNQRKPVRNEKDLMFDGKQMYSLVGLLIISCAGLLVPMVFSLSSNTLDNPNVAPLSYALSILLIVVYMARIFNEVHKAQAKPKECVVELRRAVSFRLVPSHSKDAIKPDADEEECEFKSSVLGGLLVILFHGALICGLGSEVLTGALSFLFSEGEHSSFIGMIVLPIAGNLCEHWSAVEQAKQAGESDDDKARAEHTTTMLDMAIESAANISTFAVPLMVIIGWGLGAGSSFTLDFGPLIFAVLFMAIFLVAALLNHGQVEQQQGALLVVMYIMVAITFWYHAPDPST